ncbi:MAG: tetratricopeptide repeat protein [Desulfobaccales bacterium]
MKTLASALVIFCLALGLAGCADLKTPEQKFANLEKRAAGGDVLAWYSLGLMYERGYGVAQDICQAVLCFRKAAEQGQVEAQYRLGSMYYHGQGVSRDVKQAAEWYKQAAQQGSTPAQAALGNMYLSGEGVDQDSSKAAYWHKKSLKLKKHVDFTRD